MIKTYYTTTGPVRGGCGHHHRSLSTAAACADRDADGCAAVGGYSDRQIYAVEDGRERPLNDDEREELSYFAERD